MSGRLGGPCDKCHQSHPGKDCEEYAAERDAAINEIVEAATSMKPIDQLVKMGIIRRGARLVGTGEPSWIIDNPQKFVVMDESQVLSNNDVMAAVMGRCDLVRVEKIPNQEGWHRCVAHSGGTVGSCQCNDSIAMTVILAGLQALEGK